MDFFSIKKERKESRPFQNNLYTELLTRGMVREILETQ